MKSFFKNVLASTLGVLIAGVIFSVLTFFLSMAFFMVILSSSKSDKYKVEDNTVMKISLSGLMKDRVEENPLLDILNLSDVKEISLIDIISAIKIAKENKDIKAIYIYSGYFSASSASLNEIRDALIDFKKTGKPIISYADTYMQGGYFLSSVSDKVLINPEGNLDLHGIAANRMFYKGTLDKLGVEMQIFKVGTFKSAVEPYITTKMSDANRMQVSSYINSIWNSITSGISVSRNIPVKKINQLTDSLPAFQTRDFLLANNLVDSVIYRSDMEDYLKRILNIDSTMNLNIASVKNINSLGEQNKSGKNQIAVLYAEGDIVSGNSRKGISDQFIIGQIEKLKKNEDVKAVVFRVNSRGGSAYASEQIWKALNDLKKEKPFYVSMGDYAASGGYYISCNANKIYAQPTTLTGSIGVFGMFPNIEGLTQKIGLSFDQVKTNKYADFGEINRPMADGEKRMIQAYVERTYDLFLNRCSEGRNITKEKIDSIAQGRVWTGNQALELGLIDKIGGIDQAVKDIATSLDLKDYTVNNYPIPTNPFASFFNIDKDEISSYILNQYLDSEDLKLFKNLQSIKNLKQQDYVQAMMPYNIDIN